MSADEGLHKLAEYLQQTRKQAEMAIDVLNDRVKELQVHNEQLEIMLRNSQAKCDEVMAEFENYKKQNTLKSRFKERDDWKALVDKITSDRDRLQEEVHRLESELNGLGNGSVERKTDDSDDLSRKKHPVTRATVPNGGSDAELRYKLHQAKEDVDQARQLMVIERTELEEELQRLRLEVDALRRQRHQYNSDNADPTTWVSTIGKSLGFWFARPTTVVDAPVEHV